MEREGWGRRLLVVLLVVGLSSGLVGVRSAQRAGAMGLGRMHVRPALVVRHPLVHSASGLAGVGLQAMSAITWTQQAELTSTAQTDNDGYGESVAISGAIAVVGAPTAPFPDNIGAAYIFGRSGSTWTQQVELSDPGGVPDDRFGWAVAVSGDTVVIGAQGATGRSTATGAAYVYVRSGNVWTLQATLAAADGAFNDGFGAAVAISGNTIVVGAFSRNSAEGAAYVYVRSGSVWTQQAEFAYPGQVLFAEFGWAVAVSGDTAVISAAQAPTAYVYVRSSSTWTQQATLNNPGPALGRYYGVAVAVSGDTALVSASESPFRVNGVVYVFGRRGSTWSVQTALTPPAGQTNSSFGEHVGLSGATAVVDGQGAWIFVGRGRTWAEQAQLIPSDRAANFFGGGAAISGNTALVADTGAPPAAYVFVRSLAGDQAPADDTQTFRAR